MAKKAKSRIFESIPCSICGSQKFKIIYPAKYENEKDSELIKKYRASGDELLIDSVVKCNKCDLKFINPRLKPNLIIKGYAEGSDEKFVSQASAREKSFSDSLKLIEKHAPNKGKILDIGTAAGSFLSASKKRGWDVCGCEPNKWMVKWGNKHYGLKISPGTLFKQKYKTNSFDVVTLWDVIEHTPDPSKVLKECNRILKSDGLLVINYPDIGSWIAKLLGRKWLFLLSVHLFYFTPKTITKILEKNGFEVTLIKPHYQKLELGYLLYRGKAFSELLSKISVSIAKALSLNHKQVPYWFGQTFVIAKKKH